MGVQWLDPDFAAPPHRITRPNQVFDLAEAFAESGWDPDAPALVGYVCGHYLQLLSGSHRWHAAVLAGLPRIPVIVRTYQEVEEAWGTPAWLKIMQATQAGKP